MGMPGHAAFIRWDRTVFAHIHPSGSVPMAALSLVRMDTSGTSESNPHAGHGMHSGNASLAPQLPSVVSFPYGFPQPGQYRIIVQMKRAGKVETGVFDATVEK
jgi:hypothetical protein